MNVRDKLPLYSWCPEADPIALKQAEDLRLHPRLFSHVALMPDCHAGYGMPIGGVIAVRDALIPNAVGVDIGCGMCALASSYMGKPDKSTLEKIIKTLESRIPSGFQRHRSAQNFDGFERYMAALDKKPGWISKNTMHIAAQSLGTLGGGNHFIEVQIDEEDNLWLMLHSGSRNLGKTIAEYYHNKALRINQKEKINLPSSELAFLDINTGHGQDYIRDMNFALEFAKENRRRMMSVTKEVISDFLKCSYRDEINIHHNYAAEEEHFNTKVWIHRKGATSAKKGEKGIIPGSMGTPSYIVEGLGNPKSFSSCSHGAGRVMGRNEASRRLSPERVHASLKDVVHLPFTKISRGSLRGQRDFGEAPDAYKDIDEVIALQKDLVKSLVRLRPLAVFKA